MITETRPCIMPSSVTIRTKLRARTLIFSVAALATIAISNGCDSDELPAGITKQAIKFDEVPESLRSTAQKAVTEVKLQEAWKNLDREGKLHSYEIRGKNPANGKIREVRISTTGQILETE